MHYDQVGPRRGDCRTPCAICVRRHGEYSGKDYEAVISRALLVKPLARHLQSYPDIYDVNVTCVEVRVLAFGAWSPMAITPL